jgi:predicted metal-dependent hydrolase
VNLVSSATHQLQYGETLIEYHLSYQERKTLGISVLPDLCVEVKAPLEATFEDVEARVRQRASWILRQQRELERYLPRIPERQYVSGETHRYLGRQYRLKVVEAEREWVKLNRGYLHVSTANKRDTERVRELLEEWYCRQARRVFHERLDAVYPRVQRLDIPYPELVIRRLQARWGSCSPNGAITLNVTLIQTPKSCIDYVILHELCHLKENNHSRAFYQLLDYVLPDWESRRTKLNEVEVV